MDTRPDRGWGWAPLALVAVVALGVYARALPYAFTFDDITLIKDNPLLRDPGALPAFFTDNLWGAVGRGSNYYRPLPPTIFLSVYQLFGLEPGAYRAVNLLLHAGASVLALLVARRLFEDLRPAEGRASGGAGGAGDVAALLVGLLFAVHPLHVEAVTWISGVMDVGCACFALLAWYALLRHPDRWGLGGGIAAGAAFLVACLFKEPALTMPGVVAAWCWLRRPGDLGTRARRTAWGLLPFVAALAVYLPLRAYALRGFAPVALDEAGHRASDPLLAVVHLVGLYVRKLALPHSLNVLYDLPPPASWLEPGALAALLAVGGLVALGAWALRRDALTAVALAAFVLPLAPALYLPGLVQEVRYAAADRYTYLPSYGFLLALAALATAWLARRPRPRHARALAAAGLVVALVYGGLAIARVGVWRDNVTLWTDAVAKSPGAPPANLNHGYALYRAGRPAEARAALDRALALDPRLVERMLATGVAYSSKGLFRKALIEFETAALLAPRSPDPPFNAGVAYEQLGWRDAAIGKYEEAVQRDPAHAAALTNLGIAYAEARPGARRRADQPRDRVRGVGAPRRRRADPRARRRGGARRRVDRDRAGPRAPAAEGNGPEDGAVAREGNGPADGAVAQRVATALRRRRAGRLPPPPRPDFRGAAAAGSADGGPPEKPRTFMRGSGLPIARSIACRSRSSSGATNVNASPVAPARAVRPTRWM